MAEISEIRWPYNASAIRDGHGTFSLPKMKGEFRVLNSLSQLTVPTTVKTHVMSF